MERIFNNVGELIGNTPLVRISNINDGVAEILVKVESFNPGGSIKDRVAMAMINEAERSGILTRGSAIIEPTSGNTGVGLAIASALKGYKLILTMPDTMSVERRKLFKAYGADLVLTDGALGMTGAIDKAKELQKSIPNSFIPQQFTNPANPECHRRTTAAEILEDLGDKAVDIFVATVGTGGTLTGVGEVLRRKNPNVKIVAVEPDASPVLSGGEPGVHKIQGIGAGFVPDILNTSIIDEVMKVSAEDAGACVHDMAKKEGIICGISSGAAVFASLVLSRKQENKQKMIVTILPDTGERYISTWVFEN